MAGLLPILILAAAPATVAEEQPRPAGTVEACRTPYPKEGEDEVVICVERPEGYRLDPDLRKAEKQARQNKLKPPERFVDESCASVGPMGCRGGVGFNVVGAALQGIQGKLVLGASSWVQVAGRIAGPTRREGATWLAYCRS